MKKINPIKKLGSLHIRPDWRFELIQNPAKYKLQDFVSIPTSDATCLKRFLKAGLQFEVNYVIPPHINEYIELIGGEEASKLKQLWAKKFKQDGKKKISIDTDKMIFAKQPVWNLSKVPQLQDTFLQRLIYHISNYKMDWDIQHAFDMKAHPEHSEIFRFIGYGIYCKIPDVQLAKRWNKTVRQIEAIRELFFDFSRFPKDRVANFTYLRQLANIGAFDAVDFAFFRRAFDLGDLGIRAQIDYTNLDADEKQVVIDFLGQAAVTNALQINMAVKSQKDAVQYGLIISNLADYHIKHKEAEYFDAKIQNLRAQTKRIDSTLLGEIDDLTELDTQMVDLLRKHSLKEPPQPQYKSLADLKK